MVQKYIQRKNYKRNRIFGCLSDFDDCAFAVI